MKKIWLSFARFFGYDRVIENKTKGYIRLENTAIKEKNEEEKLQKKALEEWRDWRIEEENIRKQMLKDLYIKYGCNLKFLEFEDDESKTNKQIIEELKLKVEDLKKKEYEKRH